MPKPAPHKPLAPTKSEYDHTKHYKTSAQIGAESSLPPEWSLKQQIHQERLQQQRQQDKPSAAPAPRNKTFSIFETTNSREFCPKKSTVTETYQKPPAADKVEHLWSDSSLKETARHVADRPGNLKFSTETRDTFKKHEVPENIRKVQMEHAKEYRDRYYQYREETKKQRVPVSLMYKDRFKTSDKELHDRKHQTRMNLDDKDLQYRDEQPRGKSMKSSRNFAPNRSTIPTKEDDAEELRSKHFQHLDSIGNRTSNSESFADPKKQLHADKMPSKEDVSRKSRKFLQHRERDYGNQSTSTHASFKDHSDKMNDPDRDFTSAKYRKPQVFKRGKNGEPVVQFDKTRTYEQ